MSKVKELRTAYNIKQDELAALTEMSVANFSKKENGTVKFTLTEAKIIADFFKKSIEDVFFDNEVSRMET